MNCNDAVAALVASLEEGTPMSEEQREHVRSCARCAELLDSAKQLLNVPATESNASPATDVAVAAAQGELRRRRVRRAIGIAACVALFIAAGVGLMMMPGEAGTAGFWLSAIGMAALISAGFAIPVLFVIYLLRGFSRRKIYKRLGKGRMISGVCLGLAEQMKMDVVMVRLGFLSLLVLAGGIGFWLYVALDVAMPVHPDDRQYLLRFRWRRWLARRHEHANHPAR